MILGNFNAPKLTTYTQKTGITAIQQVIISNSNNFDKWKSNWDKYSFYWYSSIIIIISFFIDSRF